MIFVTVGTQDKPFTRLIVAIENLVKDGAIKDKVIVQAGHTKYKSEVMEVLNYVPYDDFNNYIKDADIIITHGGVGSILSAVKLKKKVVAVPRLKEFGEHINNHQLQVIEKMAKDGYIVDGSNLDELEINIKKAASLEPKDFTSNREQFLKSFEEELDKLLN